VSDCLYTVNVESGRGQLPSVPHAAFNYDREQARQSILKLASLKPRIVWAGHLLPVSGEDVERQLEEAAERGG